MIEVRGASGEKVIATPDTRPDRAARGKDTMSKALSGERQHALGAAKQYKSDADLIWLALLKPYCNKLAETDKDFITALCEKHKCGVAFCQLASCLTTYEKFAAGDEFADCEARFIDAATEFFGAARATFFDLQKHLKGAALTVCERMPDARNQLREIIRQIDGNLDNAKELKEIRANRLKPVEIPLGFQAISQAQELFLMARAATAQQALSGKQPLGAVTLRAAAQAAKGNQFAIKAAGAAPIILKALHPTEAPASAPATGASITPTEAEKLARDRRRHEATGEVTTRLLCDIHGIERGALGQFLRKLRAPTDADCNKVTPIISTSDPRKFTAKDRDEVEKRLAAGAVKRRPKQPDK